LQAPEEFSPGLFFDDMADTGKKFMERALRLARKGAGWVNPNPMVGAVLVREGRIIGEGFHEYFGGPHAEVNALSGSAEDPEGATLYVTMEPCSHYGKTPPCVDRIVTSRLARVVIGMQDPNPEVNGKGIEYLESHGIRVDTGLLEEECRILNERFIKYITTGMPFVVLKTAMTLDGKTATVTNASRWITGEGSRRLVHHLRQELSAVMVGADTVIHDNPLLNIRLKGKTWKNPLKVIADTRARIPLEAAVLQNDPQLTILAVAATADPAKRKQVERLGAQVVVCPLRNHHVDLEFLLHSLGTMGIDSVMIEGGSMLAFSALLEKLVDKVVTFVAPKILGGKEAPTPVGGDGIATMEQALRLRALKVRKVGDDLMVTGYPEK
jgi:diaminohydroxyphosphoribosylaminopyrimidine deaminase/5-amino-6-(5-phosphoribosylamino)uracil reductase